jgi:hypothetical protein
MTMIQALPVRCTRHSWIPIKPWAPYDKPHRQQRHELCIGVGDGLAQYTRVCVDLTVGMKLTNLISWRARFMPLAHCTPDACPPTSIHKSTPRTDPGRCLAPCKRFIFKIIIFVRYRTRPTFPSFHSSLFWLGFQNSVVRLRQISMNRLLSKLLVECFSHRG